MTEVAASLIGIATFGIKLTTTLYEFGANAASAREQTDRIARHLRLYSEVLEVLVDRIDDGEPIHSAKALRLVDEIYDQSYDLFDNIKDLIPRRGDRMSFMRKLAWNFKKSRVALVVSEIEYLKSTVTLLVTVLFAGKKLRSSRRKRRSKKDSKKDREEVDLECAKVKIAIVEQINASAHKLDMQIKVEEEERNESETGCENRERALTRPGTGVLQHSMEIVNFRESLGRTEDQGEERALVLNHSADLIANLLDQWTTLADDVTTPSVSQGNGEFDNLAPSKNSQHDQTPENLTPMDDGQQAEATSSKRSGERPGESSREEKHRDMFTEAYMLTEAYLDVRNRAERAEEELARLKASLQRPEESTMPELSHSSTKTKYYLADTSSSESGESVDRPASSARSVICDSDHRDLIQSVMYDAGETDQDGSDFGAHLYRRQSKLMWDVWLNHDNDGSQWKAYRQGIQAETAVRMKERDIEIEQLLRRRQARTTGTGGQSTIRNQRDDRASQPRRATSSQPTFSDDSARYRPTPSKRAKGVSTKVDLPRTETPRMRGAADMGEQDFYSKPPRVGGYFEPKPVRYTGQQTTNTGGKYNPNAGGTRSFHFTSHGGQGFSFSDPNNIFTSFDPSGAAP